jgi:hypothetical protein
MNGARVTEVIDCDGSPGETSAKARRGNYDGVIPRQAGEPRKLRTLSP